MRTPLITTAFLLICGCNADEPSRSREPTPATQENPPVQPIDTTAQPQTGMDLFDSGVNPDSVNERNQFIVLGLRRLGDSLAELNASLGQPDSTKVVPTQNVHVPGQTDSIITAHFKNAVVELYRVTGGRDLIASITIHDNQYLRLPTIRIGMKWQDVLNAIGPPDLQDERGYTWFCNACVVDQQLMLQAVDGVVKSIGFAYYMG